MSRSPVDAPAARGSFVFGVLGGIASGKSEVARLLAGPAGVVLDADALAREELSSPAGQRRLVDRYGPEILGADGAPHREALAERVFGEPRERAWLEGWIHPAVRVRMAARLAEARARGVPRIVLDVPLLLENDAEHHLVQACDALVFVDAPLAVRDERARSSRNWRAGEVARREALQLSLETKRARAQHVLHNHAGRAELEAAVRRLLASLGLT